MTEKGTCDRAYRYPVRISNGSVGYAGEASFNVSGSVGANGAVTVTVSTRQPERHAAPASCPRATAPAAGAPAPANAPAPGPPSAAPKDFSTSFHRDSLCNLQTQSPAQAPGFFRGAIRSRPGFGKDHARQPQSARADHLRLHAIAGQALVGVQVRVGLRRVRLHARRAACVGRIRCRPGRDRPSSVEDRSEVCSCDDSRPAQNICNEYLFITYLHSISQLLIFAITYANS